MNELFIRYYSLSLIMYKIKIEFINLSILNIKFWKTYNETKFIFRKFIIKVYQNTTNIFMDLSDISRYFAIILDKIYCLIYCLRT
jgi:hypothetical protein